MNATGFRAAAIAIGIVAFGIIRAAPAEDIDTAWIRLYDGPVAKADDAIDVDLDSAGNVYVTGSSQAQSGMFQPIHVLTMKYTPTGDTLWVRHLLSPGGSNEQGRFVRVTADGHLIVAARSTTTTLLLIKYTASGDTVWTRPYGLLFNPAGMEINASGDIWVIGESGTGDWRTVHYHADGSFQWVATFADIGGATDAPAGLALDGSDNAYVTGWGEWIGGNVDIVTIKYSPSGSELWRRRYDGPAGLADAGVRAMLAGDDTLFVAGSSANFVGGNDLVLIRYETDGDTVWTRRFDAPGNGPDILTDAAVDATGNAYLCGTIFVSGSTSKDGTVKFNSAGDTLWARYWGPPLTVRDVMVAADGGLILTGEGLPPGAIFSDWGIQKYTPSGDSAWFRWLYNGVSPVGFQIPRSLTPSPDGGLVACGLTSSGFGGSANVGVAKFVPTCACPYQADHDANTFIDATDLAVEIDIVFFGATDVQDALCPATRGDINHDGAPDAVDLALLIDHVFFGGVGPVDPCSP